MKPLAAYLVMGEEAERAYREEVVTDSVRMAERPGQREGDMDTERVKLVGEIVIRKMSGGAVVDRIPYDEKDGRAYLLRLGETAEIVKIRAVKSGAGGVL